MKHSQDNSKTRKPQGHGEDSAAGNLHSPLPSHSPSSASLPPAQLCQMCHCIHSTNCTTYQKALQRRPGERQGCPQGAGPRADPPTGMHPCISAGQPELLLKTSSDQLRSPPSRATRGRAHSLPEAVAGTVARGRSVPGATLPGVMTQSPGIRWQRWVPTPSKAAASGTGGLPTGSTEQTLPFLPAVRV